MEICHFLRRQRRAAVADARKQLVQNVIVYWNYQYVFQAPAAERQQVANAIAGSSPVSWQHLNLQGKFDFSDDALKDSLRFDIEVLMAFSWEQTTHPFNL